MKKILVTGADGMLGSNLVRELLHRGHRVRAFLLPDRPVDTLAGLDIEKQYGNLLRADEVRAAVQGCEVVIHTAANTSIWPNRSEAVRRVNVQGTQHLVEAALDQGVERFIFVGTANSFGFGSKESPGDETRPYQWGKYQLDYMDSKYQAQQLVLQAVRERQLPALTVNPTFMFGPYDSKPGAGAMILAVYHQKAPGFAIGGRNYIHVSDVATAIANALTQGRIGESYIAGHQNLNYREAFTTIARVVGVKAPRITIPAPLTLLYGWLGTQVANFTGKAPVVSYSMAQISCDGHYFDARKAVEELNMPQTNVETAIKDCFDWLKANGYC